MNRFSIQDGEGGPKVTSFTLTPDEKEIIIAYANSLIKRYRLDPKPVLVHQFRSTHSSAVGVMKTVISNTTGQKSFLLATGSSDFNVKIWDLNHHICIKNLNGKSVVTTLCFADEKSILVGYVEGNVRLFSLSNKDNKRAFKLEWTHHNK